MNTSVDRRIAVTIKLGLGINHLIGFCALAALSRYANGKPFTSRVRTGKSARTFQWEMSCCASRQALGDPRQYLLFQRFIARGFCQLSGKRIENHVLSILLADPRERR